MPTTVRIHLDENVHGAVATGLRRRGVDVTTTSEAGLVGAPDEQQLEFAHSHGSVMVTHDSDLLRLHAQGIAHSGIAYAHPEKRSLGEVVLRLVALWRSRSAEELRGTVHFL